FKEQAIKGNSLKDVVKKKHVNKRDEELEKQIAKTLHRKNEKVKPNYKKKKKMAVEKLKRKAKREFIKKKIKEERIERYKKEARANRD
ncbi:MAG: DEAD/DEAH box helicase, partial [Erysipelotrichaceae bacterium]|nr:DEAD/DEAH box helicase [Erysipelotrichaceae bacterium]